MSVRSRRAVGWRLVPVLALGALGLGALIQPARAEEPPWVDSTFAAPSDTSLAPLADSLARLGPVTAPASRPVDYLWVVRTSLVSPEEIDSAIAHARDVGVCGVIVQVIGRGDAYYRSDR